MNNNIKENQHEDYNQNKKEPAKIRIHIKINVLSLLAKIQAMSFAKGKQLYIIEGLT